MTKTWLDELVFNEHGLIPSVAYDHEDRQILMVAWMNKESLAMTADKMQAVYFSRSRQQLWHKGETSGHFQTVHEIYTDCDADVITLSVTQHGGIACHTGRRSCFFKKLINDEWVNVTEVIKDPKDIYQKTKDADTHSAKKTPEMATVQNSADTLSALAQILEQRKNASADSSYVASLYKKGLNKILEKVGEESVEAIIAAKDMQIASVSGTEHECVAGQKRSAYDEVIYEVADLWFHTMVMLSSFNIQPQQVLDELARRFGVSGIAEKASR